MKNFIYYLMLPLMLLALAACGEKNSDPGENPDKLVPDPEGTIEVSARYDAWTGVAGIRIDDAYNFSSSGGTYFVSLGQMRGLGNITSIPKTGWASTVAVVPGNGYVAYSEGMFYRIYVQEELVGTTGGVIGYTFKYQTPFAGRDEALTLDRTAIALQSGGAAVVNVLNTGVIPFVVETSEPWVHAEKASSGKFSFLYDAVYISVDEEYGALESTEATVTFRTLSGKTTTVQVTRSSGPFVYFYDDVSGYLQLDPAGEVKKIAIVSNIGSTLQIEATGMFDVRIEPSQKPSAQPSRLRFIGERPADEKDLTRAETFYDYNIVITAPSNFGGKLRQGAVSFYATSPSFAALDLLRVEQKTFRLDLLEQSVQLPKEAGEKSVLISTDLNSFDNLSVTSSEKWCRPALSYDEKSLVLTVDANTENSAREAEIKVLDFDKNEITILQVFQYGAGVHIEQNKMYFQRKPEAQTITVKLPDGMTGSDIQCSENWLSATMTGTDNNSLTIRVTETTENRMAYVTFKGYSNRIEVHQSKYAVGDTYSEDGISGTVCNMEAGTGWLYKSLDGTYSWSTEKVFLGATDRTDGRINTEIVKSQPNWEMNYPAFAAVDALNVGGVTGWYLPAVDESENIKMSINNQFVWTSTELNDRDAYYLYYSNWRPNESSKQYQYRVYAVHRFEY